MGFAPFFLIVSRDTHASMKNDKDLEEQVRRWLDLEEKIENLGKKAKASGKALEKDDSDRLVEHVVEFVTLERRLISTVADGGVIDHLSDPRVRGAVLRLMEKGRDEIDEELSEDPLEMDDEMQDQAWDLVYALIGSPKELLLNRRRISSIVALAEIPERIRELFEEAKICYVTFQQNAVMALGRMMLEYAVTDIGVRLRLFPEPETVDDFYREYPPYERADRVLGKGSGRRQQFRDLYQSGSQAIHHTRQVKRPRMRSSNETRERFSWLA